MALFRSKLNIYVRTYLIMTSIELNSTSFGSTNIPLVRPKRRSRLEKYSVHIFNTIR